MPPQMCQMSLSLASTRLAFQARCGSHGGVPIRPYPPASVAARVFWSSKGLLQVAGSKPLQPPGQRETPTVSGDVALFA